MISSDSWKWSERNAPDSNNFHKHQAKRKSLEFLAGHQQANEMIRLFCENDNRLIFVDAGSVLLNADGKPNNEYFLADKLHMNEKGYQKWTQVLRPVIEREFIRKGD